MAERSIWCFKAYGSGWVPVSMGLHWIVTLYVDPLQSTGDNPHQSPDSTLKLTQHQPEPGSSLGRESIPIIIGRGHQAGS
jgi:hypothetical protein